MRTDGYLRCARPAHLLAGLALSWVVAIAAPAGAQVLCAGPSGDCVVTASVTVTSPTAVYDLGGRNFVVKQGVEITVGLQSFTLSAASILFEPGAKLLPPAEVANTGTGPTITLNAATTIRLQANPDGTKGSTIRVTAEIEGGQIDLNAGTGVTIDGQLEARALQAGFGGTINIRSATGDITLGGLNPISAKSGNQGIAGGAFILAPGGDVVVNSLIDVTGGDGGTVEIYPGADFISSTNGKIDCSATASIGDAGFVQITAGNAITMNGTLTGKGSGSTLDGGGTGADVQMSALAGSILLNASLDLSGAAPDGQGGSFDADAALDLNVNAAILAPGRGSDGCAGDIQVDAGRTLTLGPIDLQGGSCGGGTLLATSQVGASLRVGAEINADGSSGGPGGDLNLRGSTLDVFGNVHANGAGGGQGGRVTLHGCTLTIAQGATVSTRGQIVTIGGVPFGGGGQNLLQANGQMTIGGSLLSTVVSPPTSPSLAGVNRLEYVAALPTILATAIITPARTNVPSPNLESCIQIPATTTTTVKASTSTTTTTSPTSTTLASTTTTSLPAVTSTSTTSTTTSSSTVTSSSSSTVTSSTSTSSTTRTTTTSTSLTTFPTTSTTGTTLTTAAPTTTTTAASTTTVTLPPECAPGDLCEDGDACTTGTCDAGRCVQTPASGPVDPIACQLINVDSTLALAGVEKLGGPRVAKQLARKVHKTQQMLDAGKNTDGVRARRAYKKANKQLAAFIRAIGKNRKVDEEVRQHVLGFANDAASKLQPLLQ